MKRSALFQKILTGQSGVSLVMGMLLFSLLLTGCAQTEKAFTWVKSAPKNFAQRLPEPPEAHKIKNPANLHVAYARWQEQLGNLSEAQTSYEQALSDNPKSVDAVLGLARLDHLAGRELAAEHGFKKALRMKPNDGHTMDTIGQFYVAQKKWPQAIEMLTAAMAAEPKNSTYEYHLGIAYARAGDLEKAYVHLEKTVGRPAAHYNIGYVLMESNHYGLANDHLRQAIALNPELVAAQTMLEAVNKKLREQQGLPVEPVHPGLNNQKRPVIADQNSPSLSIQPVSGDNQNNEWKTLTVDEQTSSAQTIIPQSYEQSSGTKEEQKWAPAIYTPQYDQQRVNHAYAQPQVQSNRGSVSQSIQISPANSEKKFDPQPKPQGQLQVPVEIPEQFPGSN